MADSPRTPEDLRTQVEAKLDELHTKIQSGMDSASEKINDLRHWSWLAGPLPGLLGEVGVGQLVENFKAMCTKVWNGFKDFCAKVWEFVGDVAGRPLTLMQIAAQYNGLRRPLDEMSATIAADSNALTNVWTGVSAGAYTTIATAQSGAVAGVAQALNTAAELLSGAAEAILQLWTNLMDAAVTGVIDIASKITTLADLGKVAFADAGPMVDTMLSVIGTIWATEKVLVDYVTTQGTTVINSWNSVNGGVDGLPGFAWPPLTATTASQYNSGDWHTAAGG